MKIEIKPTIPANYITIKIGKTETRVHVTDLNEEQLEEYIKIQAEHIRKQYKRKNKSIVSSF